MYSKTSDRTDLIENGFRHVYTSCYTTRPTEHPDCIWTSNKIGAEPVVLHYYVYYSKLVFCLKNVILYICKQDTLHANMWRWTIVTICVLFPGNMRKYKILSARRAETKLYWKIGYLSVCIQNLWLLRTPHGKIHYQMN